MKITTLASGSGGNAYVIDDGCHKLLLDAGIPIVKIQENVKVTELSGCLVTHSHKDHAKSINDLAKLGVRVFAPEETIESTVTRYKHYCSVTEADKVITYGGYTIMPFACIHDVPTLGYLILSNLTSDIVLYATDTAYVPINPIGVTHLMLETNYDLETLLDNVREGDLHNNLAKRIIKTHMSIDHACDWVEKLDRHNLQEVHLLHLSRNNSNAAEFKERMQKITGTRVFVH